MAARKPKAYRVKGPVAVIRKGKHERYVNRGGVFLADALDEANAEHLLSVGLIEPFELKVEEAPASTPAPAAPAAPAGGADEVQLPEGEPSKEWTHKQIDVWTSRQEPPLQLDKDLSIDKKLAAIAAAKQS